METIKILYISANPIGTTHLKLDEEVREIEAKIRAAEHRDCVQLITKWAARPDDLLQALNQHRPHVVHFSGHGSPTEQIVLLDKQGNPKPVSKEALVSLFKTLKDNIRVVLLNACYSRPQAVAITGEIDCAIGMTREIGDAAAITFAAAFYRALGFGRSVKDAFDQGKTALLLEGIPEEQTPDLITKQSVSAESVVPVKPSGRQKATPQNHSNAMEHLVRNIFATGALIALIGGVIWFAPRNWFPSESPRVSPDDKPASQSIIGKWRGVTDPAETIEFLRDETVKQVINGEVIYGKYKVLANDRIETDIGPQWGANFATWTYSINGNKLTRTSNEGYGGTAVFVREN